jgi:tetratricopeptide (TPR) repeat protein
MASKTLFNPFPGLRPFEPDEDHLFFGREQEIDELLRRLRTSRFLQVVGTSGTGKSSLVRSGLIPALQSGSMVQAGSSWRILIFRPGNDPIGNLAASLDAPEALGAQGELASTNRVLLEATLRRSTLGLVQAVRQANIPPEDNILVVVDQFEELFRFRHSAHDRDSRNEAAAFSKLLLEATKQEDIPIYIVLTMRSDFLGDCLQFQGLPEAVNTGLYLVPRMTRDELRSAISGPVAVGGGEITQRLVLRLLNDLGDDHDQLPILQHALMRTWDRWEASHLAGQSIDIEDYEAIGGLQQALSLHAEEAYQESSLGRGHQITEKIFKALTDTFSDPRGVRRPNSVQELAAICEASESEVIQIIEIFRRSGRSFLTPHAGVPLDSSSIIDLSHESLMRCWSRLITWAEAERQSAATYMRVAQAASWCEECSGGLWIDPELESGLQWRRKNQPTAAWAERYDSNFARAMDFLDRSEKQREAEREKERRRKRARQIAIYGLSAMLVLIGALTYVVYKQRARAEFNLKIAKRAVDESLSSVGAQQSREAADSPEMDTLRRDLLDKARIFYQQFAKQDPGSDANASNVAMAHMRLGDIYRILEMHQAAVNEYTEAIAQFGTLVQKHPGNFEYRQNLAYGHNWLGETLRGWLEREQKPTEYTAADAEKQYDAAVALQQELHRSSPGERAYPQELARSYYNRGILRYDGHSYDQAEADFLLAVDLLKPLSASKEPSAQESRNHPSPSQDLARVYNNLGSLYLQRQQFQAAAQLFEQAIGILANLMKNHPDNREYKKEIAQFYNNLALALADQRKFAMAADPNHKALDLFQELAEPSHSLENERAKILALHNWILEHESEATTASKQDFGPHPEFHIMYMNLGRSYVQIAREYLNVDNLPEAEQAIESLHRLLPKLAPTERAELVHSYEELRKELRDKASRNR